VIAADRLVRVEPGNGNQISYPNVRDLSPGGTIEGLAGYALTRLTMRGAATDEQVLSLMVSPAFFELLGVQSSMGRTIGSDIDAAVITSAFWRRQLNGRPDPIGAVITLNGHAHTVVGVLPDGYRAVTGILGPDVYVPLSESLTPDLANRRRAFLTLLARLRPAASPRQAGAEIAAQMQALERIYPEENAGFGRAAFVFPVSGLASWQTRDLPTTALVGITSVPFAIFGLVLLIACANVAGLLLARGAARRGEIAIRLALGASRGQVVTTLLAESVVLSLLGAVAGLLLTHWLCRIVSAIPIPQAAGPLQVSPDSTGLGYALVLTFLVTLSCGLLPALASTRPGVTDALRRESAEVRRRVTSRGVLVTGQIAVASLLLFLSILVLRSLHFIREVDPGFSIDEVITARVDLDQSRYPADARLRFAAEALEAARAVPGIASASLTNLIPLGGDVNSTSYAVERGTETRVGSYVMHVGPDYFKTMSIRLRQGREFSLADRSGAPEVAIVSAAFVRAHGLASTPIGDRVRSGPTAPWLEIVGVVDDSNYAFFGEAPHPILFRPFLQAGGTVRIVARGAVAPASVMPPLAQVLATLDPSSRVDVTTMRDATGFEASIRRTGPWVLGSVGVLGMGLALVGVYGLLSYTVTERTRELGIRMALGSSRLRVQWLVLRNAAVLVGGGVALGTLLAIVVTRPLAFLLSGVGVSDPMTIAVTAVLFLGAGLAAAFTPSLRATRVDPIVALRSE
jgi:predicted permease